MKRPRLRIITNDPPVQTPTHMVVAVRPTKQKVEVLALGDQPHCRRWYENFAGTVAKGETMYLLEIAGMIAK